MKSNELMIGDWVYDTILKGNTRVEIISLVGIKGDFHENIYNENTFEPIPLTPEILKRNGFINGEFYAESHIEDWQIMSDCIHLAARSERGWCIDIPCRYVHELQHALRLCGIEKEIEL